MTFFLFFFSLILYFLTSNLYIFNLCIWYLLSILYLQKPNLQYTFLLEREITGLTALSSFGVSTRRTFSPQGHLCLLPTPSLLYPTLWISVCSKRWRTLRELITGWICLFPFHFPLLSSGPPPSPSSLFSLLYNAVNISEQSRLWRTHKEMITG